MYILFIDMEKLLIVLINNKLHKFLEKLADTNCMS